MRATSIRYNKANGSGKPTKRILVDLCKELQGRLRKAGFITNVGTVNGTSISIRYTGYSCFVIDPIKLGYNARVSRYVKSPKGYKRTTVPTWDQRVEFNDIVNAVFNQYHLDARIKSGLVTVRDKKVGAYNEEDWKNQMSDTYSCDTGRYGASTNGYGEVISEVMTETEARETLNSDHLEADHKEATKAVRLEAARKRRDHDRMLKNADTIPLKLSYHSYNKLMESLPKGWFKRSITKQVSQLTQKDLMKSKLEVVYE